ncbi:MAG: hypothetical protein HY711_11665 [Candidatus Melainabacteria bacterium]|nr:hypothetical protein [Candidatus Melainabacteria bacterium]
MSLRPEPAGSRRSHGQQMLSDDTQRANSAEEAVAGERLIARRQQGTQLPERLNMVS